MARQKTNVFKLTLTDDSTNNKLWSRRFTRMGVVVNAITAIVVLSACGYALFALTPVRTLIPGYPDAESKRAAIENAIRIDSLERIITRWEFYSENLRRAVDGETPLKIDSILAADRTDADVNLDRKTIARNDSLLKNQVLSESKFEIKSESRKMLTVEGILFFTPLKGVVAQGFERMTHPYLEITAPGNSAVMAVLEGTIISAGWSDNEGYAVRIQHAGGLVSAYSNMQKLLKSAGDKVNSGTPIAMVSGADGKPGHLRFELWHDGEALDPAKYISF
jgi:Membrane-bound metallopeptidase